MLIRRPEHVPQVSVHDLAIEARCLSYRGVASKHNAITVVRSAYARSIYGDGDTVLRFSMFPQWCRGARWSRRADRTQTCYEASKSPDRHAVEMSPSVISRSSRSLNRIDATLGATCAVVPCDRRRDRAWRRRHESPARQGLNSQQRTSGPVCRWTRCRVPWSARPEDAMRAYGCQPLQATTAWTRSPPFESPQTGPRLWTRAIGRHGCWCRWCQRGRWVWEWGSLKRNSTQQRCNRCKRRYGESRTAHSDSAWWTRPASTWSASSYPVGAILPSGIRSRWRPPRNLSPPYRLPGTEGPTADAAMFVDVRRQKCEPELCQNLYEAVSQVIRAVRRSTSVSDTLLASAHRQSIARGANEFGNRTSSVPRPRHARYQFVRRIPCYAVGRW